MNRVELNTDAGPIVMRTGWDSIEFSYAADDDRAKVILRAPDVTDERYMIFDCKVDLKTGYHGMLAATTKRMIRLLDLVSDFALAIDAGNAGLKEEMERKAAEQREREEREQREREEEIQRRKDILLNELVGERVNLRQYKYKTMRQATVDVREVKKWNHELREYEVVGYEPQFNYVNAADHARTQRVEEIKRCDVKIPGTRKWKTVWEDGMDDLNPWERDSPSLRPVDQMYDGSCQIEGVAS